MKKVLIIAAVFLLYYNWDRVDALIHPPAQLSADTEVVLYATSWCGYCKKTRALLEEQGIAYVEYDIEKSERGRKMYKALGGTGVPVLEIGDEVIYGFDERAIRAALR